MSNLCGCLCCICACCVKMCAFKHEQGWWAHKITGVFADEPRTGLFWCCAWSGSAWSGYCHMKEFEENVIIINYNLILGSNYPTCHCDRHDYRRCYLKYALEGHSACNDTILSFDPGAVYGWTLICVLCVCVPSKFQGWLYDITQRQTLAQEHQEA